MNNRLTLLELNNLIRDALQDAFPAALWIVAEISEMKVNRTGHCYLELVEKEEDSDDIKARARATIWSYTFRMIRPYFETSTGQPFREGIKVLVQVAVEYHPSFGMSLNIKDIDPTYTLGDLARRRKEIIRQLEEAGVIAMNRELPLPLVPQRIAVISSATAAGYQDFADQLDHNPRGFRFYHRLFEAFMQGAAAVPSILDALDEIFREEAQFDAVVVIRGGGAQADLGVFDNFELAYAVAQFPLPVITGIGHEKDETILDLVAHTRLKTPTAVAEFFIGGVSRFQDSLEEMEETLVREVRRILNENQDVLEEFAGRLSGITGRNIRSAKSGLQRQGHRLHLAVNRFIFDQEQQISHERFAFLKAAERFVLHHRNLLRQRSHEISFATNLNLGKQTSRVVHLHDSLRKSCRMLLLKSAREIAAKEETTRLLDPGNVLQRGYTLTLQNGVIIKSASRISGSVPLETIFRDGSAESVVTKTKYNEHKEDYLPGGDG